MLDVSPIRRESTMAWSKVTIRRLPGSAHPSHRASALQREWFSEQTLRWLNLTYPPGPFPAVRTQPLAQLSFLLTGCSWHRWLLYLFESELRNKCSYQGGLPYWDISLDNTAESFVNSPIFDNVYGFGGNGPYIQDLSDPEEFPTKTPTEIPNRTGGGS